jgi:hypothetical protein
MYEKIMAVRSYPAFSVRRTAIGATTMASMKALNGKVVFVLSLREDFILSRQYKWEPPYMDK